MVKVLLLNNSLFDGQKVVSIENEPNIILGLYPILQTKRTSSSELGSGFLVATKDGNLKIYSIANSEGHQSGSISEEPIHLEPFSISKRKIQEKVDSSSETKTGNVILAAEYLPPPNNVIVTLEKESENSLINVVRLYYLEENESSSSHRENEENKERGDEQEKEIQVGKIETIRATSSISCIAVCPISSRLAIAKRNPPVISVYNIHCRKDSSSVHLEAEHILDVLIELSSPIPLSMTSSMASNNIASIRKLAIYDSYLAYSTQFDVRIINIVFSQSKGKGNEEKETKQDVNNSMNINQLRISHDEPYGPMDDEYVVNFSHDVISSYDGTKNSSKGSKKTESPAKPPLTSGKAILGPIVDMNLTNSVRVNRENGFLLISATLILLQPINTSSDISTDLEDQDEDPDNVHTISFSPDLSFPSFSSMYLSSSIRSRDDVTNSNSLSTSTLVSGINCLISTGRKGYVYDITKPALIASYPYTNISTHAATYFTNFLYAITSQGLEVWTRRNSEFADSVPSMGANSSGLPIASTLNENNVVTEPCLVGLLPFIGLQRIVISGEHLILLSKVALKSKEKGMYAWNVYCLRGASTDTIFQELLSRANSFKIEEEEQIVPEKGKLAAKRNVEESVYYQLLLEAHILRMDLTMNESIDRRKEITKYKEIDVKKYFSLYTLSASLIANYYLENREFNNAALMYAISNTPISTVLDSFLSFGNSSEISVKPLIRYLDKVLFQQQSLQIIENLISHLEVETVEKTIQRMIEIYKSFSPEKLSSVILDSFISSFIGTSSKNTKQVLQEYALNALQSIYENRKQQTSSLFSKDMFAIGYLKARLGNYEDAKKEFQSIKPDRLVDYIHQYRHLLFSNNNSSSSTSSWYSYLEIIRDYVPWSVLQLVVSLTDDSTVSKPPSESENIDAISTTFTGSTVSKLLEKIIVDILNSKASQELNMGIFLFIIYLEHVIYTTPITSHSNELYSILASLYFYYCFITVTPLVITSDENKEENNILRKKWMEKHDSVFIKLRYSNWIDSLATGSGKSQKYTSSFYLKKIQGILSYVGNKDPSMKQKIASSLLEYTNSLSSQNTKLINDRSSLIIQLLCLPIIRRLEDGVRILISNFPQEAVSYGCEFCVEPSSWKIVLNMFANELEVLKKKGDKEASKYTSSRRSCTDVIEHLSKTLDCEAFLNLLPENGDIYFFLPYLENSFNSQKAHTTEADLLKSLQ